MFIWLRFIVLVFLAVVLSLSFVVSALPVNLLLIFAIVFIEYVDKEKLVLVGIVTLGILIDIFSGNLLGVTSIFLLGFYHLSKYIGNQYINLGININLIIKTFIAFILHLLFNWLISKLAYHVFDSGVSMSPLSQMSIWNIFISFSYILIITFVFKTLIELIFPRSVGN